MVLVDAPIWSEFFRRGTPRADVAAELRRLVEEGEALLVGPVRQEILSGIGNAKHFEKLRGALRGFRDAPLVTGDYDLAAAMFNRCRAEGVQGSNTDFLICAVSERLEAPVFTLDQDFLAFQKILGIQLHPE